MTIKLYMDVHVPQGITDGLRRRGIDVLTAFEDGANRLPDDQLLERARLLGRVMFTHDIRFRAMAEEWQRQNRSFAGLLFGQQGKPIGDYIRDLELIAQASELEEWLNQIEFLPL